MTRRQWLPIALGLVAACAGSGGKDEDAPPSTTSPTTTTTPDTDSGVADTSTRDTGATDTGTTTSARCGNNTLDPGEECDDGNTLGADGCSPACLLPVVLDARTAADARLLGEDVHGEAGASIASVGDIDGDGRDDLVVGAPEHDGGGTHGGAAYVVSGPLSGTTSLADATARILGTTGFELGASVAGAGDVNADGLADVLVGAPEDPTGNTRGGAAYLFFGPVEGQLTLGDADATLVGTVFEDRAATSLDSAGDLDGDGYDDLVIGSHPVTRFGYTPTGSGVAYIVPGPVQGRIDLSDAMAIAGVASAQEVGRAVAGAGDPDGDGLDDLLVGAPGMDRGGPGSGVATLWRGPVSVVVASPSAADEEFVGEQAGDRLGHRVDGGGDVSGDGLDDILLGTTAGRTYLVHGPAPTTDLAQADAVLEGAESPCAAGDLDGDGFADLVFTNPSDSTAAFRAGAAFVAYGPVRGTVDLSLADITVLGDTEDDVLGSAGCGVGDLDGDGLDDLGVGAPGDDEADRDAGSVSVLFGP